MHAAFSLNIFSQTYEVKDIYTSGDDFKISHLKPLENNENTYSSIFSIWGIVNLKDDIPHLFSELDFFKGNASETFKFLTLLNQIEEKYPNKEIRTSISETQIRTYKFLGTKYMILYDKNGRATDSFTKRQLSKMLKKFTSYCEKEDISYLP